MQFLTVEQAGAWCADEGVRLTSHGLPRPPGAPTVGRLRCAIPEPAHRGAWFAAWLVLAVPGIGRRLLWPTEWGIWPSSENWTLVARLRAGYGERRPHEVAPVLDAEPDEVDDLAAFLQVGMSSGWDLHLLGTGNLLHVFVSHDGFVEFTTDDPGLRGQIAAELESGEVTILA